ncbi:MAG: type IV secretory system conjugative DNA transfer family protein, partial [Candidatus Paceibacteria bacterium]
MMNHEERITFFGSTDSRGKSTKFGIKSRDRTKHTYVIGKTGMGKSTLLENMAIQDIANGEGLAFIDPHGSTAEKLLEYIPEERIQDVLYFAPFDLEHPISFNVMENVEADKRHLVANGLMSVFEKTWEDQWSARMAYILNNTILALLEYPDATLLGINRMLADKAYRKKVVENITDPSVKSFWIEEFAGYSDRYAADATPAIQNKIGQYTSNSMMRNIIGQPKSSFDLREIMDTKKILIINLSKGRVGEGNANLLGSMLITKLYLAAMSRADVSQEAKENLPNFYLYVDEFQSFANRSFADILSEARKYKLNLTIAHQYIEQMSEEVRAAVFGNVGTMITFRIGAVDAEVFEKEYAPTFTAEDLVNLGFTQMYLKLMIDGVSSQPFSATSLPPIEATHASFKEKVMTFSREHYGKPRSLIEDNIKLWHEPIAPQHSQKSKPKATDTAKKSLQNKTELPSLTEAQLKETQKLNNKHSVNPNP